MHTVVLSNATWSLGVLPAWGGRIAHLNAEGLDILLPINASQFDPLDWPRAGAYPLMPYSNRIRNARLQFAGTEHALPAHHLGADKPGADAHAWRPRATPVFPAPP